jgi:hypothetical protein
MRMYMLRCGTRVERLGDSYRRTRLAVVQKLLAMSENGSITGLNVRRSSRALRNEFNLKTAVKESTVVQMTKSAKDFYVFCTEPWHRQSEYGRQKSRSDPMLM